MNKNKIIVFDSGKASNIREKNQEERQSSLKKAGKAHTFFVELCGHLFP